MEGVQILACNRRSSVNVDDEIRTPVFYITTMLPQSRQKVADYPAK